MGVVSAFIVFFGKQILNPDWTLMKAIGTEYWSESTGGEILGFAMFVILLIYLYWDSTRIKE
jgi:hypothetical protein